MANNEKNIYAHLEGKEITVIGANNQTIIGIVGGCDYDIGLTIVEKDTKDYVFCYIGPLADPGKHSSLYYMMHNKIFNALVSCLETGVLHLPKIYNEHAEPSAKTCPFNQ